jgi:hypothetical protein
MLKVNHVTSCNDCAFILVLIVDANRLLNTGLLAGHIGTLDRLYRTNKQVALGL